MNRLYILIALFWPIQLISVFGSSNTTLDLGCLVKNDILFRTQEADSFCVTFFISPENPIKVHITFLGREWNADNDLLILKPNSGKIQRRRDDRSTAYDISLNNAIPYGWNYLTINVIDKKMDIGDYYTHTVFEYEIDSILFKGEYSTSCTNRTPIWKIDNSSVINIPLTGLSRFGIRLYSSEIFHPDLTLNTIDIPLSFDGELVIRKSNLSLPQDDYSIYIEKHSTMISIFYSSINEESMLLLKAKVQENLKVLTVKSLEGYFYLILNPFQKHVLELETTEMASTTEKHCICEAPSLVMWIIMTGTSLIAAGGFAVLWVIEKRKIKSNMAGTHGELSTATSSSVIIDTEEAGSPLLGKEKGYPLKQQPLEEYTGIPQRWDEPWSES